MFSSDMWPVLLIGWILGIIGFYRANKALKELAALRAELRAEKAATVETRAPAAAPVAAAPEAAPSPWAMPAREMPEEAAPQATPEAAAPARRDFETVLTQRWGVWLGAVALLFAGVFLVRYAAEQGVLGPAGRCVAGALLGAALLAAAEWVRRHPTGLRAGRLGPDQVPGALAAGGAAVLFAAAYGAGSFYALVPPAAGFLLMALAALAGLAAALRFGPLAAAIGLAGAFATPALVESTEPSAALLFAYLFAVTAAALAVMRWTAWTWLGWAAAGGGTLWLLAALGLRAHGVDAWAIAMFAPAATALNLGLLPDGARETLRGRALAWCPMAAMGLAILVVQAVRWNVPALQAGPYLLGPAVLWTASRDRRLDRLPWLAAAFGLLGLLISHLPQWRPTGEAITVEGVAQAWLPGAWAPPELLPFLGIAGALAGFNAAVGLWLERRAARPVVWAALPAGVPVLAMAVGYARVARFQADIAWGAAGLVLAGALVFTAHLAMRAADPRRAGAHAAGAAAALALACAMVLHDHWLSLALSAFLPALALIEARTGLAALRSVALAVAVVVLVRLLPNVAVLHYAFGATPLFNGLIAAYAMPAAAFAAAALLFRRTEGPRVVVEVLEGGAVALLAAFVALEIRHAATGGAMLRPGSFTEAAFDLLFLAAQARVLLDLARRGGRRVLEWAWRIEGAVALAIGVLLILGNPVIEGHPAGAAALAAAYLLPALLVATTPRDLPGRFWLGLYAVVAGFVWIFVQVRLLFHPDAPGLWRGVVDAEMWCWSGGWLAYGVALLTWGMGRHRRDLRQAGLAVVALAAAKVFLLDMAGLGGLWRVLAFLGLGFTLIGLGAAYRRFVPPATGYSPPSDR